MINEKKVKLMTRMAFYEQNEGREDLKIGAYYQKDYVGMHAVCGIIWVTIGYALLIGLLGIGFSEVLLKSLSIGLMVTLLVVALIVYIGLLIVYIVAARMIFKRKYQSSRMRIKKYNHDLTRLLKLYEKENG